MTTTRKDGHYGKIRTEWPWQGTMAKDDAERFAAIINRVADTACGRGGGDRPEGAFATVHQGIQTVGIRGCDGYRRRVVAGFTDTAAGLVSAPWYAGEATR